MTRTDRKMVIMGDGGIGKTTLVRKLVSVGSTFDPTYVATLGAEVYSLSGVWGDVNIWDCAGQERFGGLRDGYWINANAVIVMCDATSVRSANNVATHIQNILRVSPGARVMILCNLFDSETKQPAPMSSSVQTILNQIIADLNSGSNQITFQQFDIINVSRDRIYNSFAPILEK